jgi:HPr kinase/phosphorylase
LEIQLHGSLVQVLGVGVLLLGPSGVGKSECALELVCRGHRLVADDVVRVRSTGCGAEGSDSEPERTLLGLAPALIRHHMEIRGIGLLYIPDLYGPDAVVSESRIDLMCHLEPWHVGKDYERVGLERPSETLAGVRLPSLILPVRPSGSMATLVEVAVRDHLQRRAGVNAAQRLDDRLRNGVVGPDRGDRGR